VSAKTAYLDVRSDAVENGALAQLKKERKIRIVPDQKQAEPRIRANFLSHLKSIFDVTPIPTSTSSD